MKWKMFSQLVGLIVDEENIIYFTLNRIHGSGNGHNITMDEYNFFGVFEKKFAENHMDHMDKFKKMEFEGYKQIDN